jgi:hypothetical protein
MATKQKRSSAGARSVKAAAEQTSPSEVRDTAATLLAIEAIPAASASETPAPAVSAAPIAEAAVRPADTDPQPAPASIAPVAMPPEQPETPAPQLQPRTVSTATAKSLAAERAAMTQRRLVTFGGLGLAALLIALLAYRLFAAQPAPNSALSAPVPTAAVPTAQPAPALQANPTAVPTAAVPTAQPAPALQANPTAAPVATLTPQTGAAPSNNITCSAIAGLPVYAGANCTAQDSDQDDGVTKLKNRYTASATADEVSRFYESSFGQNGWTLGEFKYDINQGQRRVKIEVQTDQGPNGAFTKVQLTEQGATAQAGTTCAPIAGLPALPNATCIKFKTDQEDGVFKTENTYSTTASPDQVRSLYGQALAQNGWTGQEFQYDIRQGLRRVQIDVDARQGTQGSLADLKIEEK